MANLIRKEKVPGQDREIRYFDDGTSSAVSMPKGYFNQTPIQSNQTQPIQTPDQSTSIATQTPNNLYGDLTLQTPEERAFIENQANQARTIANTPIDEGMIRQNTLAQFQAEIDALNRVYAEKKQQEMIAGQGRMGSVGAVGARRGLIGSDFGIAQERQQEDINTQRVNAIESERLMLHNAILSDARSYADKEIAKREAARKSSAEDYLNYISSETDRRRKTALEFAKRIYASGQGDQTDFESIAKELGISVEALKSSYLNYKKEQDALIEQQAAEEAKKLEKEQKEEAKKAEAENLKRQETLLKEGYNYINTPAERDRLKALGYDIVEIGGRTYGKKPKTTTKSEKIGNSTYMVTRDDMGNILKKEFIRSGGSGVPTSKFNEKEGKSMVDQYFYGKTGSDGKLSPDDYNAAKAAWIEDGGSPERFDALYYKMKNPANEYYQ